MELILLGIAVVLVACLIVALARRERRFELANGYDTLPKASSESDAMIPGYVACYGILLAFIGITIALLFRWASTSLLLLAAFAYGSDWNQLLYIILVGLGGIVLFGFVIATEASLRASVRQKTLLRRVLRFGLVLAAIFVVDVLIRLGVQSYLSA